MKKQLFWNVCRALTRNVDEENDVIPSAARDLSLGWPRALSRSIDEENDVIPSAARDLCLAVARLESRAPGDEVTSPSSAPPRCGRRVPLCPPLPAFR